jgi:hypothetical protein
LAQLLGISDQPTAKGLKTMNDMKKFWLFVIVIMLAMLGSACVSKSTYEHAQEELVEAQSQVQSLENQRTSLQSEIHALQSELEETNARNVSLQNKIDSSKATSETLKTELATSQKEVQAAQAEIDTIKEELAATVCRADAFQGNIDAAKPYLDVLDQLYLVIPDDADDTWLVYWFLELNIRVDKVGDPELKAELDKFYESDDSNAIDVLSTFTVQKIRSILEAENSCP